MKKRFSSRPILKTELIEVFERGRKSWNIRKKRTFLLFLLSFLSCMMIEAKITAWPDMVLNYSEEIFKAIMLLTRQD